MVNIKTDQLSYAYKTNNGVSVLKDVSLTIGAGEYVLLCGASGSGKSTLCKTFNGLIPHFYPGTMQGVVRIAGRSTGNQSVRDLFVQAGMVFQNPEAQLFNSTVEREIAFGLESLGIARSEIRNRIDLAASSTGLTPFIARNPHQLSGGEQQLTAIAAILAIDPDIIILDEPYANLDPVHVIQIREILRRIHRQGKTVIISEHRLTSTLPDVQRVVILDMGRIVSDGPPDKLLSKDALALGLELRTETDIQQPAYSYSDSPVVLSVENMYATTPNGFNLDNINFDLKKGECVALVGANGSGKTTLLKHLNGLYRPSSGRITVCGQNALKLKTSQLARYIGTAFQNPCSQFFKLTMEDEIKVGAEVLNCYDKAWLDELVNLFRLKPLLKRSPHRLSGGEKKRVAFAAAMAAKPAILALDEPTAGQDGYFRKALGEFLIRLRRQGQAVLLITHDLAFASQNTSRWLVMSYGKLIADEVPCKLMADHNLMRQAGLAM
ncbi:ATP-binding cassette domain-containing protein [Desulfococcaceae bacterium HSG7]|nr:ATP-binding cassette domain-containing protein [Desulfococcaceae bacterium HSG7]